MGIAVSINRTDNRGRILLRNESQIKNGSYTYRYFDGVFSLKTYHLIPMMSATA